MIFKLLRIGPALFLLILFTACSAATDASLFGTIESGHVSLYNESKKQDLSGTAVDPSTGHIIFVDDDLSTVRVIPNGLPLQPTIDANGTDIPLTNPHKDLEAATFADGYFYISTSMVAPKKEPEDVSAKKKRLTRFQLSADGLRLENEESVDIRPFLFSALKSYDTQCGDGWYDHISNQPGKEGGLNIEGLSVSGFNSRTLLWGLRSPLCDTRFGNPKVGNGRELNRGEAIIAEISDPFGTTPTIILKTLDLNVGGRTGNHGIRSIEWIPALDAYVIIGGSADKGDDYSLWLWDGQENVRQIDDTLVDAAGNNQFENLCQPETVMQITEDEQAYLVILSEESGACEPAPSGITYLKIGIN